MDQEFFERYAAEHKGSDGLTHVERAYARAKAQGRHPASQPASDNGVEGWAEFVSNHPELPGSEGL